VIKQFHFNIYLRYYMLTYFDLTFFSVMKIVEGNDSTHMRRLATLSSYVIICVNLSVPLFLSAMLCWRYKVLKIKEAKQSFSTLVLKLDKSSWFSILPPIFFFFRRCFTAIMLSFPLENPFVFIQYMCLVFLSNVWSIYLINFRPYKSRLYSNYMATNESFYSLITMYTLIFTDS